jgi:hypothetical protein
VVDTGVWAKTLVARNATATNAAIMMRFIGTPIICLTYLPKRQFKIIKEKYLLFTSKNFFRLF